MAIDKVETLKQLLESFDEANRIRHNLYKRRGRSKGQWTIDDEALLHRWRLEATDRSSVLRSFVKKLGLCIIWDSANRKVVGLEDARQRKVSLKNKRHTARVWIAHHIINDILRKLNLA